MHFNDISFLMCVKRVSARACLATRFEVALLDGGSCGSSIDRHAAIGRKPSEALRGHRLAACIRAARSMANPSVKGIASTSCGRVPWRPETRAHKAGCQRNSHAARRGEDARRFSRELYAPGRGPSWRAQGAAEPRQTWTRSTIGWHGLRQARTHPVRSRLPDCRATLLNAARWPSAGKTARARTAQAHAFRALLPVQSSWQKAVGPQA